VNRLRLLFYLVTICSLAVLAACRQEGAPIPTRTVQAPLTPPVATETVAEPAPEPAAATATIDVYPVQDLEPTPIPTAYPVQAYPPIEEACQYEYFFLPSPDTCPADFPIVSTAAEQPFEGGTMVWLGTDDLIVILFNDRSWRSVEDTWEEGQLEGDPSIEPPADRYQPIRGFGKVWRENPDVRQQLGWALGPELGFETTLQDQEGADGIPDIIFLKLFNGQIAALTKRDINGGDWVVASSP
jgi:hypothetical protein